jgi:hypothetical protein
MYLPTPPTSLSSDSSLTGRPAGSSSFHRSLTPILGYSDALYLENNNWYEGQSAKLKNALIID